MANLTKKQIEDIGNVILFIKYIRMQEENTPSDTRLIYLICGYFDIQFDDASELINELLLGL